MLKAPKFIASPFFDPKTFTLKRGAPKEVRNEFNKYKKLLKDKTVKY